jgi:hypothetical protein
MPVMPRAPRMLWRSTTTEVVRALVLATVALVGVIAFIGAVRPLAEGRIGLADALRLTGLLAIPMLQFALPFAAGFAATMGYHRAASENEVTAAHAAGIGHRTVLAPALVIGVALAGSLWVLANYAIPGFLNRAEGLIQRDLARIVLAPLERGETIRIGSFDIHADRAVGPIDPPPGSAATASIALFGVVAVQASGGPGVAYASDERVDLWLFDDPEDANSTVVQFAFTRPEFVSPSGSLSVRSLLSRPYRFPRTVKDDPKFLSFPELMALRSHPDRSGLIRRHTRALASRTASAEMVDHLARELRDAGRAELTLPEGVVEISGARLVPDAQGAVVVAAEEGTPITVTSRLSTRGAAQTQWATSGRITTEEGEAAPGGEGSVPTMTLELTDVTTLDPEGRVNAPKDRETYSVVTPAGFDAAPFFAMPADALIDRASGSPVLARDVASVRERIARLVREIDSKVHERAAYSVACLIMVVLGGVMAIRLRDAMVLPVYLWSFIPALGAVISISAGQGITHDEGMIGLVILWGGVATLAVVTVVQYRIIRRH